MHSNSSVNQLLLHDVILLWANEERKKKEDFDYLQTFLYRPPWTVLEVTKNEKAKEVL